MDNWKDLLGKASEMFKEAKEIVIANPDVTAEDWERSEKLMKGAKELQQKALQLKDISEFGAELQKAQDEQQGDLKDVKPSAFKDWGEFLEAAYFAGHREPSIRKRDDRLNFFKEEVDSGHEKKQMVENTGGSGGFLVPVEFQAQLQALAAENAIVRPKATVIRMRRRQLELPVLDQTGSSTGSTPNWFGGMLAYWAEEATEKTISTASFRKVVLTAHKLIMYTRASDELVDDSAISLADFLAGPLGFAGAINWQEDYAFLQGTGAGQPLGIINAGATISVARAAQLVFGYADLVNMVERFLPNSTGQWQVTQAGISNLMTITDTAGNYIWQPNAQGGVPNMLLGYPVRFTEKVPTVGTAGDVSLCDWRYYLVGDRQATTVESTQFDFWRYDQTSWRAVHRVDGQPWLSVPYTTSTGLTVSPFVILGDKTT